MHRLVALLRRLALLPAVALATLPAQDAPLPACTLRVLDSAAVTVAGGRAYIEPQAVVPAGRSLLLAGIPAGISWPAGVAADPSLVPDSLVGAIRDADGRWTPVRHPPQLPWITGLRALARGADAWDVTFIEMDGPVTGHVQPTRAAWHGELTARGWARLERLPVERAHALRELNGTRLTRQGDTLTWGLTAILDTVTPWPRALVLRRYDGAWHQVATVDSALEAVAVSPPRTGEQLLTLRMTPEPFGSYLVVAPLTAPPDAGRALGPPDRLRHVALRWTALPGPWSAVHRLDIRDEEEAWWHTVVLDGDGRPVAVRRFTWDEGETRPVRVGAPDAPWLYLAHEGRDTPEQPFTPGVLHLLAVTPSRVQRLASLAYDYFVLPALEVRDDHVVHLDGPVVVTDATGRRYETRLLSVGIECRD